MANQKKRHHIVPVVYLERFADDRGMVVVTRKDAPDAFTYSRPTETGFRRYYYSQPVENGSQNNNALEDIFSKLESEWDIVAKTLESRNPANHILSSLLGFVGLQRVRVPAFRDAIEHSMERYARQAFDRLKGEGKMEPPLEFPNLLDEIQITIDPHQSIHAMVSLMAKLGPALERFGYTIAHNETSIDLITSDNPVCYFKSGTIETMVPYPLDANHPQEFLFPISPRTVLVGSTVDRHRYRSRGLKHVQTKDEAKIRKYNHIIARFAYETLFSKSPLPTAFVVSHAEKSPVLAPDFAGFGPNGFLLPPFILGSRRKLLKYR